MKDNKWREFWVYTSSPEPGEKINREAYSVDEEDAEEYENFIRVVEIGAVRELEEKLRVAEEALKESCYCDAGWYRSTKPCNNCEALEKLRGGK